MVELTDAELIANYLKGDQKALEELVQRYFKQVFLFARTYVKQDAEAEDVTQDAFVKAWKNLKKFDRSKKFKTWIFQITKNTCIDYLRKNKNLLTADRIEEEQMALSLEQIKDSAPLPEELFDAADSELKLSGILNTLPKPYKQVVEMYLQQDLSFQEIADVLGEPLNTVKSRYRRALLKVKNDYLANSS